MLALQERVVDNNLGPSEHPLGGDFEGYIDNFGIDGAVGLENGSFMMLLADGEVAEGGWDIVHESRDAEDNIVLDIQNRRKDEAGQPYNRIVKLDDLIVAQASGLWDRRIATGPGQDSQVLQGVRLQRDRQTGKPFVQAMAIPANADLSRRIRRTFMPLSELRQLNQQIDASEQTQDPAHTQRIQLEATTPDPRGADTVRLAPVDAAQQIGGVGLGSTIEVNASGDAAPTMNAEQAYDAFNAALANTYTGGTSEDDVAMARQELIAARNIWSQVKDPVLLKDELYSLLHGVHGIGSTDETILTGATINPIDMAGLNKLSQQGGSEESLRKALEEVLGTLSRGLAEKSRWYAGRLSGTGDIRSQGFAILATSIGSGSVGRATRRSPEIAARELAARATELNTHR